VKIEIKCRFTGSVLFEHDAKDNSIKLSVIAAVEKKVSLSGAYLSGAILKDGSKVDAGPRPFFYFGLLGSNERELIAFRTDKGVRIQTGCFFGTVDEFKAAVIKKHGENEHGQEYMAALAMVELHFKLWKKGK